MGSRATSYSSVDEQDVPEGGGEGESGGDEREARGLSRSATYSNVPLLVPPRHFNLNTPR